MRKLSAGNRPGSRLLRSRRGVVGLAIVLAICAVALLAPWLAPDSPTAMQLTARRQPPSLEHPMGLDELGRDNLTRVIYGARLSLRVGVVAALLSMTIGGLLGLLSGYLGGWADGVIVSLLDVMFAVPTLLLAIAVIMILGRGLTSATYAVAVAAVPVFARLVRVGVLSAKGQDHVLAARALGVPTGRLLARHILPAAFTPVLVQSMLFVGTAILEVAGLSFLGLGAQPPAPEWGAMIAQGRGAVFAAPHVILFPGLAIVITVLGFNFLGDGLRDALDPRSEM
jgi:peptide/nickel transport system permease protein